MSPIDTQDLMTEDSFRRDKGIKDAKGKLEIFLS